MGGGKLKSCSKKVCNLWDNKNNLRPTCMGASHDSCLSLFVLKRNSSLENHEIFFVDWGSKLSRVSLIPKSFLNTFKNVKAQKKLTTEINRREQIFLFECWPQTNFLRNFLWKKFHRCTSIVPCSSFKFPTSMKKQKLFNCKTDFVEQSPMGNASKKAPFN